MNLQISTDKIHHVINELENLDNEFPLEIEGKMVKPSNCYFFGTTPPHILFNTNCPDVLKQRLNGILQKYIGDESGAQTNER